MTSAEFANCLARDAQRRAVAATSKTQRSAAIGDLRRAQSAARRAVSLSDDKEGWGVQGSTLKRLATVDVGDIGSGC